MLFVNRVNVRCEKRAVWIRAGEIEAGDRNNGEVVPFGELPSQLGRVALVKGVRHEEVKLIGVAQSRFVGDARADTPHVGYLAVDPADIAALAINRAVSPTETLAGIISLGDRPIDLVRGGQVIVDAPKELGERIDVGRSVRVVVD